MKLALAVVCLALLASFVFARPVLLIVDASGSMTDNIKDASGNDITKIDAAKQAGATIINSATDEIALMAYFDCSDIQVLVPFTTNKQSLLTALNGLTPDSSTPIATALQQGAAYVSTNRPGAGIVLLTDGEETCGGDPEAAATAAHAGGVSVINVVGLTLSSSGDQGMTNVAAAGGGNYYPASNTQGLQQSLQQAYQGSSGGSTGGFCCPLFALLPLALVAGVGAKYAA